MAKRNKLPKSLTTVTTFSKLLAMVLFVLLPFAGFYIGMQYQKKSFVAPEEEKSTVSKALNNPDEVATAFFRDYLAYANKGDISKYPFNDNPLLTENFKDNHFNFLCAANIPGSIRVAESKGVSSYLTKVTLLEHFASGDNPVEVNLILDNSDAKWKINSTNCPKTYAPSLR